MGRRKRRSGPGVRAAMAVLAGCKWRPYRSDRASGRADQEYSRLAANDCFFLECKRIARDEAGALSCLVSVLCARRQAFLPALSTQCRYLPGGAVQHCLLRLAYVDDGAKLQAESRGFRAHIWRRAPLPQPFDAGARTIKPKTARPARNEIEPGGEQYF